MAIFGRHRRAEKPADRPPTVVGNIQEVTRAPEHTPSAPPVPTTGQPAAGEQRPVPGLVGRFPSAAAALAFHGELLGLGAAADAVILLDHAGGSWWIAAELATPLARELISTCGGRGYLLEAGWFVPERGWGAAAPLHPRPASRLARSTRPENGVHSRGLTAATPLDLIRLAGLQQLREAPQPRVTVLVPGFGVAPLVRRALELGLRVTHRPVGLRPLFADPGRSGAAEPDSAGGSVLIAVEIARPPTRREPQPDLPESLLRALALDPLLLLCRMAGDELLVQYGLGAAVADRHLLAMIPDDESWLLADATFGCAVLEELAEPRDSSGLIRLPPAYEITAAAPDGPPSTVEPVPVTVVAATVETSEVDAVLLTDDDLPLLGLLLRGHPLAEHAWISFGRDLHLLFAAGSLLQRLPVGEPLQRIGPGALYLPVGYRLDPAMPPSARGELFAADSERAVILRPDQAWEFDVSVANREPVWTLWVGELPQIDWQVPDEVVVELDGVESEFRPKVRDRLVTARLPGARIPRLPVEVTRQQSSRTWRDTAWEHEAAGDLAGAAELFERHGDPVRAAHLYEAAARADGSPRRRR